MKSLKFVPVLLVFLALFGCSREDDSINVTPLSDTTAIGGGSKSAIMRENQNMTALVAWPQFHTIKIHFLNGTTAQQDTVKKYAAIWDELTNLTFEYVSNPFQAQVRIQFSSETTSGQSYVGYRDNLLISLIPYKATMLFYEDLGLNAARNLFAVQTIRHEFGHMMGLVHEHIRPDSGIDWVEPVDFSDAILMLDYENYLSSDYDIYSIMHYPVYSSETKDGKSVAGYIYGNGELSDLDVEFIQSVYPIDGSAPSATTIATRNP